MDNKEYLTNRAFCPMPWTGLMYNFDGNIKNCIRSASTIGNIQDHSIQEILANDMNVKDSMQLGEKFHRCSPCYDLEQEKNKFNIISDRIFYLKELRNVDRSLYDTKKFDLNTIDVRWSNLCNLSCVYCGPEFSSKWASELNIKITTPKEQQLINFKNYIFDNVSQLKHVYLAGGEPLLMKENLELLILLKEKNPEVNIRVNTNLSKVDTKIFDLICEFKNVHWIVSLETIEDEYEYIRFGNRWKDFLDNLQIIKSLNHKISFNMLYFILNYRSLFGCVDFLKGMGFHNNSFIIGALLQPDYLNIRHLPDSVLNSLKTKLEEKISERPGFLLENSYINMLKYISIPTKKDLANSFEQIRVLDTRRNLDSKNIFKDLYKENYHGKTI